MIKIPLSVPSLRGKEWQYVKECIDTEWVSSAGKYINLFEEKIAEFAGVKNAVACVNGTSALQVSLRLAGVTQEDEVIVPTLTFIAPINAVIYNGAKPVFMDADEYHNMDPNKTIEFILKETKFSESGSHITINKKTGKRIAAIIPVHVWGNAARIDKLFTICKKRNIAIVEDASESLGTVYNEGKYEGRHSGTIGQLGCLSFNGNKIITSGGGGMILTDDNRLAEKARYLTTQAKDDPIRYIHHETGYNFRMTNIQAALGLGQLEQLPRFLDQKRKIFYKYQTAIKNVEGLKIIDVPNYARNNHWMNLLEIDSNLYGEDRESLMNRLEKDGIQTRPVWRLNHLQKPYKNFQHYKIKNAEEIVKNCLCLPSSTSLTDANLKLVINKLNG